MILDIFKLLSPIADKFIPDKDKKEEFKHEITIGIQEIVNKELETKATVLKAEIQGESWLQRSWRPILMLVFASLLVLHWLGFTSDTITNDVVIELLDIVKVGLGGYVVGRSAEKIMKEYKK